MQHKSTEATDEVVELRGEAKHTFIASLMEPAVLTIAAAEIILSGFELAQVEGELREFAQGWLVRHVSPGEKRMRRGEVPM